MRRLLRQLVGQKGTREALGSLLLISGLTFVAAWVLSLVLLVVTWILGLVFVLLGVAAVVSWVIAGVRQLIRHVGNRSRPSGVSSRSGPPGPLGS